MAKARTIKTAALGICLFVIAFLVFNWANIKRLSTVNSLFDADKIVQNFSNMDAAFLHKDLEASPVASLWPESLRPLPETVSINGAPQNLSALLEEFGTTALVIIKDGELIHESYYQDTQRDDLRISWSVAKSFMSALYGGALERGQIRSLDDKAESYVPVLKGSAYEGVSLRNLLNMASGVVFNEDYLDPKSDINKMGRILGLGGSMDDFAAGLKLRGAAPGSRWHYVSIDTHVAAMVLREATSKSLHQLFNETYSDHLGFGRAPFYLIDGEDVAFALGGLNLRTRDYAKFGQLFLQGGAWNGNQIIPQKWVTASTVHSAPNLSSQGVGYGYQWWVPMPQDGAHKGDFYAGGIYGQYIYVNPAAKLVIAKNAADREFEEPAYGYSHSKNVHIDMFRSLAAQLTAQD